MERWTSDEPLSPAERSELLRLRRLVAEQEKDLAFLGKATQRVLNLQLAFRAVVKVHSSYGFVDIGKVGVTRFWRVQPSEGWEQLQPPDEAAK